MMSSPIAELAIEKLQSIANERKQLDVAVRASVHKAIRRMFSTEQEALNYVRNNPQIVLTCEQYVRNQYEAKLSREEVFLHTLIAE